MNSVRIEITLPAAPQQAAQHVKRVVVVTIGGKAQAPLEVDPSVTVLPAFTADIGATVQVSVAEHLVNGKSAVCQSPAINPADHVEAVAAEAAGFAFRVTAVQEAVAAEQEPARPPESPPAAATAPEQPIDPATGRVVPHM